MLLRIVGLTGTIVALGALAIAGLLIFGTAKAPPPLPPSKKRFSNPGESRLPTRQGFKARDGADLTYRVYPSGSKKIIVLLHGADATSAEMHVLASAMQRCGLTVYVPDLRGHGPSYPHGDLAYIGQLDDDLSDFMASEKPLHNDATWTLIGFSSGGGLALRIAAEPAGQAFDRYILLAPFLGHDAPTIRKIPRSNVACDHCGPAWTTSTGRIVALMLLDKIGVHRWDGLSVLSFAAEANTRPTDHAYSWRMLQSFQPHADFSADVKAVSRPMHVLVGSEDERFLPEKFEQAFHANRNDISTTVLPGLQHSDMVTSPEAIRAILMTLGETECRD